MSASTARKAAPRPAKPAARYWRGKAPKGIADVASASESDESGAEEQQEDEDVPLDGGLEENDGGFPTKAATNKLVSKSINIALKDVDISKEGKVIVGGREESGRTLLEEDLISASEDDVQPRTARGLSEESSEYESESDEEEEEAASVPMFRPVFVPKRARTTVLERDKEAEDSEEVTKKKELEAEERRKQSHDLVAESIRRELAEKEKEKEQPDVDDTDGLDPDAEFEAWRLRELARIKRDKEEQIRRDEEREEIERRRAMPEEQRLKEDLERAKTSREERPKGQQKFLQKYWHKGAFHQDDEIMKKHDYTQATLSTVDVSLLPKVMQVRDFGKRSRTKYTHLVDQDTTVNTGGFGGAAFFNKPGAKVGEPGGGCFNCGGPHLKKDCPLAARNDAVVTGTNRLHADDMRDWGPNKPYGEIKDYAGRENGQTQRHGDDYLRGSRDRSKDRKMRQRYDDGSRSYKERDVHLDYGRRSRSRSPGNRSQDIRSEDPRKDRRRSRERSIDGDRREEKRPRVR